VEPALDNIGFGICCHTAIALRAEPSERAELVSQLLFGEHYMVAQVLDNWLKVVNHADGYWGYINKLLHCPIIESHFNMLHSANAKVVAAPVGHITRMPQHDLMPIVAGSLLPFIDPNGTLLLGPHSFEYKPQLVTMLLNGKTVVETALSFLNAPYLWGGKTYLGIDCSGLSQICYKVAGMSIGRDASQQVKLGRTVSFINEAVAGDLAFFDNAEGKIIHVGILTGKQTIIHASGFVRVDKIDHQGIYNSQQQAYSHKLRIIKRLID
jgi:gamma-D-glutamyl-L-lysine dipeptidyl-peptidase